MHELFQMFLSENLVMVRGSENKNRKNKYAYDSILDIRGVACVYMSCVHHPRADAHT